MQLLTRMRLYAGATGFGVIHLLPFLAFYLQVTIWDWVVCAGLYFTRIFFIGAGYHRYFSHKSYKTSRVFQFILAFMAQTSIQKGVLWWASHHRKHHRYSDQKEDTHSPKQKGVWYSHVGWVLDPNNMKTDYTLVKDFEKYPEIQFLNKNELLPPTVLGIGCFLIGGWSMLLIGFFLSTVLVWHSTFTINSLSHVFGKKRYNTKDDSRNNWILAILTLGEGWHNNHHYYPVAARQGFKWWEYDITYYILKFLSIFRVVWDIREVPENIKKGNLAKKS